MFRWYKNAAVCYVYLFDVSSSSKGGGGSMNTAEMAASRWFTRGWTLQELIAPKRVWFYSASWDFLGTKTGLCDFLAETTGIDADILNGGGDLEATSVARRMSWASMRKTSRVEDMAYCLLGIFDVNIPLIYGEGPKAFQRLQEAIMLKTHDQSLFAWGRRLIEPDHLPETINDSQFVGLEPIPSEWPAWRNPLLGLFADSPALFQNSGDIEPAHRFSHELRRSHPPVLLSGGVYLGLVMLEAKRSVMCFEGLGTAIPTRMAVAVLLCSIEGSPNSLVGIVLRKWGEGYHGRTPDLIMLDMSVRTGLFRTMVRQRHVLREQPLRLRDGDIIFRRQRSSFRDRSLYRPGDCPGWRRISWGRTTILRLADSAPEEARFAYTYRTDPDHPRKGIVVTFQRVLPLGSILVQAFAVNFRRDFQALESDDDDEEPASSFSTGGDGGVGADAGGGGTIPLYHIDKFYDAIYSHQMKTPCDSWALEFSSFPGIEFPRIYVRVERKEFDGGIMGAVDIVDMFVYAEGQGAERAKRAMRMLNGGARS